MLTEIFKKNHSNRVFPSINICGHILDRFTAKQTNTVDRISISFFLLQCLSFGHSSRVCCFVLFLHFWFFRPTFHHLSPQKAEYEIIPSTPWQRISFFLPWMMQLYQYLPNSGTLNAYSSDDIWYCCIIAEIWFALPRWFRGFQSDSAGNYCRLQTLCYLCRVITGVMLFRCPRSAPVNIFPANSPPQNNHLISSPHLS